MRAITYSDRERESSRLDYKVTSNCGQTICQINHLWNPFYNIELGRGWFSLTYDRERARNHI